MIDDTDILEGEVANDARSPEEREADIKAQMAQRLAELRVEHRRIDAEINAARETGVVDMLKVQRMKKIKLSMRDQIVWLENQLTPDIIA